MKIYVNEKKQEGEALHTIQEALQYGADLYESDVEIELSPGIYRLSEPMLKTGDIILGINGENICKVEDLKKYTKQLDQPVTAQFRILRDQKEMCI